MDEQKQSYALLTIVVVAILAIAGGVLWYSLRAPADDYDFEGATTTPRDETKVTARSESIALYSPRANERIGTPLVIQGEALIYEDTVHTVQFRLLDSAGKEISVGYAVSDSTEFGQYGAFRGELHFISETDQQGTLEVYRLVKADNSEIDKITLPVTITKTPDFIKG